MESWDGRHSGVSETYGVGTMSLGPTPPDPGTNWPPEEVRDRGAVSSAESAVEHEGDQATVSPSATLVATESTATRRVEK